MWMKFDETKANKDCYNKNSYMEYLEFTKTPTVFGTEYDIIMLCEFLKVSNKVFSPSLFSDKQGCVIVKNLCIMEIHHKR